MRHAFVAAWTGWAPAIAGIALAVGQFLEMSGAAAGLMLATLIGAVLAAVHHAEVIAHRVGEPFGTLVLALAITVIEASLIVSLMVAGGGATAELTRNTLFATIMIVCNGVIGICLLVGAHRYREQEFSVRGAGAALSVLIALGLLTLGLPTFTTTTPSGTFSQAQLGFAAVASLLLYSAFVFIQTVRHRDYFLPAGAAQSDEHMAPPSGRATLISAALLLVCLVAVVGIAKLLSPAFEAALSAVHAPTSVVGIVIALLVLLPESIAALRAAQANRLQTSFNLAYGSALASIGLTIPAVVSVAILFKLPLVLGLGPKDFALLTLTYLVSTLTLATGRTNVLQGAVHLVVFGAFLFFAIFP